MRTQLPQDITTQIDKFLAKFPDDQRQSAVISSLFVVQKNNGGWLSTELMDAVADYIGMPKIAVYEVASFYSLFDLEEVGKHKIYLCTNIACMLRGSKSIAQYLQSKLNIKFNETTADGKVTLKSAECLGACGGAPMLQLDDQYHENLTFERIDALLEELD